MGIRAKYIVNEKYISSGEVTGIILNMVKNAIEAHANKIKITSSKDFFSTSVTSKGIEATTRGRGIKVKLS